MDKELVSNGKIPVYSANVTAPFGFIDKLLITDFSVPSVLWGIDGDWMTSYLPSDMPFYPTDHCGVLRCKTSEVNPRYLAHLLEVEGGKMGFSRSYRASIDRVQGITFTVPDISIQNNAMSKVEDHEMTIKELEGSLEKIDQVGYWCLINVLNAKDFREFLGNSAAFDFYCEYTKFDFNKFDVSWLLNLYPHTLEQIAKNEKVKGCVRVAIADALNDGEIALSDSQRLQSILIKHFC